MKKFLLILMSVFLSNSFAQSVNQAMVETQDIENFWIAFDSIQNLTSTSEKSAVFQTLYLDKATDLFQIMIGMSGDISNPDNYLKSFEKYPKFWKSIRHPTLNLRRIEPEIQVIFEKVRKIYPQTKPAKVCIFMGPRVIQGSEVDGTIYLGAELNLPLNEIDLSEFDEIEKNTYQNKIKFTIVHEIIHLLQSAHEKTLLSKSILEGSADFLAELIIDENFQNTTYDYGRVHEEKLWSEFIEESKTNNLSKWLYAGSVQNGRPSDLGYFIGYMITKAYYENSIDKTAAIKEIIEVSDFENFLEKSKYAQKFK